MWSRSRGFAFHLVYRIAPFNEAFIRESIRLRKAGAALGKGGKIPISKLMMAILNEGMRLKPQEHCTATPTKQEDFALREAYRKLIVGEIEALLQKDKEAAAKLTDKRISILNKRREFCSECNEELFNYWAKCADSIICLNCALNHSNIDYNLYRAVADEHIENLLAAHKDPLLDQLNLVISFNIKVGRRERAKALLFISAPKRSIKSRA